MAHDGKALARARAVIQQTKRENEAELTRRRAEAFERLPQLRALEAEMTELMSSVALCALKSGSDAGEAVKNARERSMEISSKRAWTLRSGGYPEDYLDDICTCPDCRDTGYVSGKPCTCLEEAYRAETVRLLSSMLDLGGQSFERFDLSLYEPEARGEITESVRAAMGSVFELCRRYAENFGDGSVNLLFRGGTGLGKTFLSACIAKVVSEKGRSVVYGTSVAVMEAFEAQKFDRGGEDSGLTASQVRRYLNCDLLILDDLGTEMVTAFTQSALYTLINTRLTRGGKTIISTNLTEEELQRRYSPQIVSRLWGEYLSLVFTGRDIRTVKKERGL